MMKYPCSKPFRIIPPCVYGVYVYLRLKINHNTHVHGIHTIMNPQTYRKYYGKKRDFPFIIFHSIVKFPMGRRKYSSRPILENLERIDINELSPVLKLVPDRSSLFYDTPDALPVIEELTFEETDNPDIFFISGFYKGHVLQSQIGITHCAYSHPRYFFLCRQTGQRVSHLYVNPSGQYVSRFELEASYRVQREHRAPFFLMSRVRDLRKKAIDFQESGVVWKAYDLNQKAQKMEDQFVEERIGFFTNQLMKLSEKNKDPISNHKERRHK